ncbi:hypothetical protein PoB_007067400 [Plakobranchus ocellatus]|uniref:Uncharacterized protein n=1 Tax=Plakobranchus ocellatus TaxID=259542 RepID=A0AAV4DIZ7_9GAST|nr:hypothetical protein PoB_007067400 [Plakobranchus ocellatus]
MRIQESSPEQEERIQSPQPEHGRRSPENNRIRSPSPSLHETEGLPPADQETQVKLTYATQNDGTQCEEDESEENECETFTKMPFVGSRADENQGNPDNNGLAPFTLYRGENLHANNGASCSNEPGHAIADVAFARITADERKPESINAIPLLFTKKKGESKTEKTSPASVGVVSKQQEQSNSDNGSVQEQGARSPSAGHEHRLPEQKRIRSPAARQREPEQSRSEKNNVIASVTIKKKQENKPRDSLVPFVGAEQEIREPGNSSSRAISAIKKEQNSKPEVRSLVSFTDTERENNEPENNSGANSVTNMRKQEDKTGGSNLAFSTGMDREKSESENNSGAIAVTKKSKQKDKPGDSSLPFSTGKEQARSETENNSAAIAVTKKSKQKDKPGDSSLPFSTGKERARSETENNSAAIAVTKKSKQEDKPGDSSLPLSTGKERARSETENKGDAISVNHEDNGRSRSTNDAQAKRGYLNAQESSRASLLKMIVLDDGTRQYTWDLYISGFTSLIHSGKEIASGVHQVESLQVQGCIVFLSKHSLQVWFTLRAASQRGDRHHSEGEWHGALQPGESTSGTKPSRVELHRAISNEDEVEPSTAAKDERTGARFKAAFVDLNGHLNEMVIGQPIEVKRSQIMERARERRLGSVRCNQVIESGYTSVGCGRDTAVLRYTVQLMD